MRALITGKTKLAGAILERFHERIVYQKIEMESTRVGADIPWKYFDIFINCAAVDFKQTELLNECFNEWRNDSSKLIINIGSRAYKPNISKGYLYAAQKAALNHLADNLIYNSDRKCGIMRDRVNSGATRVKRRGELLQVTLDRFHLEPDLIHLDIEGMERSALKGMLGTINTFKPAIVLERANGEDILLDMGCLLYTSDAADE